MRFPISRKYPKKKKKNQILEQKYPFHLHLSFYRDGPSEAKGNDVVMEEGKEEGKKQTTVER